MENLVSEIKSLYNKKSEELFIYELYPFDDKEIIVPVEEVSKKELKEYVTTQLASYNIRRNDLDYFKTVYSKAMDTVDTIQGRILRIQIRASTYYFLLQKECFKKIEVSDITGCLIIVLDNLFIIGDAKILPKAMKRHRQSQAKHFKYLLARLDKSIAEFVMEQNKDYK